MIIYSPLISRYILSPGDQLDIGVARFIYEIQFYSAASLTVSPSPPLPRCQVHLLRTAGDEVTITVRYLREVPSFLKLPLGKSRVLLKCHGGS